MLKNPRKFCFIFHVALSFNKVVVVEVYSSIFLSINTCVNPFAVSTQLRWVITVSTLGYHYRKSYFYKIVLFLVKTIPHKFWTCRNDFAQFHIKLTTVKIKYFFIRQNHVRLYNNIVLDQGPSRLVRLAKWQNKLIAHNQENLAADDTQAFDRELQWYAGS